jgi:hypothetical protein
MTRLLLTILTTIFFTTLFSQNKMSGEYVTNFPSYGMFGEILTLNCDGTAVLNFRGDLMNDSSYGHWTVHHERLIIFYDKSNPNARHKDTMNFNIKDKKLYQVGLTKKMYKKIKTLIDKHNKETGENLQLPSYDSLSQTSKDFYGKTGIQYFEKTKSYVCERKKQPPG